jgi:probable rRNA maturation factor
LSIRILYDDVDFRLRGWRTVKKIIEKVISEEGKVSGDLNFIITDDKSLKEINVEFLKHNYFTDVISFDNGTGTVLAGEIYISLETVIENANNYNVSLNQEFIRVMIHGVLHLCGYDDKTAVEKSKMRAREDYWLELFDLV